MLLMMGEVLGFGRVSAALPGNGFWAFLARQQEHVAWTGCSLHDMIQPSFSFLVGVALPFSLARRSAEGQPRWRRTCHAFWRATVLVLLGVFLRSVGSKFTNWTFEDTLTQIGLGYGFLYLAAMAPVRWQWMAFGLILLGYWLLFAFWPLPGAGFDWAGAGVSPDQVLPGFAGHWSLNANPAWAFDRWFLNLFPHMRFTNNHGGYATLSFIPTLATMMLGLIAGGVLRSDRRPLAKVGWLIVAGIIGSACGWLLGMAGICPVVKRIWTPSWVLYSGGLACGLMAVFYLVIDIWNRRAWAYPLTVVGMNSIAAYLIAHLWNGFISGALVRHFGRDWIGMFGKAYEPLVLGAAVLFVEWAILAWMNRRKIYLRV